VGIYDQCSPGSYDRTIHEGVIFGTTGEDGRHKYVRRLEDGTEEEVSVEEYELSYACRAAENDLGGEEKGGEGGDDGGEGGEDEESVTVDDEEEDDEESKGEHDNHDDEKSEHGDGDENDEIEEEDEEEESHWNEMDARPALNVLRDIARWYRQLIEVPGEANTAVLSGTRRPHDRFTSSMDGSAATLTAMYFSPNKPVLLPWNT